MTTKRRKADLRIVFGLTASVRVAAKNGCELDSGDFGSLICVDCSEEEAMADREDRAESGYPDA